jgi:uncharacterized heparinase superfamily protein
MHFTLNAAGIPHNSFGGHKHNDLLAITLEVDSVPILVDAGTACYTSGYRARNASRSTEAHNTVLIDREEQQRYFEKALFYMFRDARPHIDLFASTGDKTAIRASHDGYSRLPGLIVPYRCNIDSEGVSAVLCEGDKALARLCSNGDAPRRLRLFDSSYYPRYGIAAPAQQIRFSYKGKLPSRATTTITCASASHFGEDLNTKFGRTAKGSVTRRIPEAV